MSNDYFKAQGWFKTYALNSQDSRGVFQQLVKEDEEEAARLASAETDKIKEEMNKKLGPGTVKYGSEIPQPEMKTPQAIFEFSQRNPAAEGGRQGFAENNKLVKKINPGAEKVFMKSTNDLYEQFGKEVVDAASIQEYGVPFNEYRPADDVKGAKRQNFIRYFKKDMKDYGEYIGTKNPDKDRRTMKRGIRAEREAALKVKLINKIKDGKKFNVENFLKKNNLTLPELKKEAVQLQRNIYTKRMIATGGKSRATLKWLTDDINTTDKVLETLSKSKLIQNKSGSLGNVMFDAFGREFLKGSDVKNPDYNVEKLNAIKKNLNEYNVLNKYLQDTYGINTQLDHPLSQQTIKKLMNGTAEELSRVNILEQDLNNGFKKTLNDRYLKAVNNNNLVQKRAVEKIAKDLNFNIGSVPDGQFIDVSKIDRGVGSFETLNIKDEMLKSLKNAANLDSEFTKYIIANPDVLKDAGINIDTLKKPKNVANIASNMPEIEKGLLKLAGTANKKCKGLLAYGGRAGLAEGLSPEFCINEGKKVARDLVAKNIKGSPAQNSIMKRITSGVTNFAKSILDPKELFDLKKQLFSKGAIASLPIFDAVMAADDALRKDMDPKEAFAKTLSFGSIPRAMGFTDNIGVINAKKMLENPNLSPAGKEYAQLIIDSGDYEKMQSDTTGGMTKKFTEFTEMQEKIKNASTAGRFDYENALAEMQGTFKAKPKENKFFFDDAPDKPDVTPLTNKLATPAKSRGPMTEMKKQKVDLTPTTYENYKPYSFTKKEFEDTMRQVGALKEGQVYNDDFYKETIEAPMKASQFKEYMELPSFRGTQEKFSEGGIASLNVKK